MKASSFTQLSHVFTRLWLVLFGTLALGTAQAAKVGIVNLAGEDFGHANGVDANSSPTTLDAQSRYYYRIEGTVHGTGLLALAIPNGTDIADLLEDIEPGSSAALVGFYDNAGGGLPFTFINEEYDGSVNSPAGTVVASLDIVGTVNESGTVRLEVKNVTITLGGAPLSGTVVFEAGSKATIGVPPILQFDSATATVAEDGGSVQLTVARSANSSGSHMVHYATANGTAQADQHYTAASGDLNFGDGVNSRNITVNITNNGAQNADRTFTVTLTAPTLGAELGATATVTVTIQDDDTSGPTQALGFAAGTASFNEDAGTVQIAVQRTGGTSGTVSVKFKAATAAGGDPNAGSGDYDLTAGTLTFADGVTTQNIDLTLTDDTRRESTEDLRILLFGPVDANLGAQDSVIVSINDNDSSGYAPVSGGFTGLGGGNDYGFLHFNTTATGGISGSLLSDGAKYSFKGKLDGNGAFTRNFAPKASRVRGASTIALNLQLAMDNLSYTGTFGTEALVGERDKAGTKTEPVEEAGNFTALLGVNNLTAGGGPLSGYLSLKVAATGAAKFKGALPDGATLKGSSRVSVTGKLPIGVGLYTGKAGFFTSQTAFAQPNLLRWTGPGTWTKPAGSKGLYGETGLTNIAVALAGVPYVKPAKDVRVLADLDTANGAAVVRLDKGNLPATLDKNVTVSPKNKVTVDTPGDDKLKVEIVAKKGTFSGDFLDGDTKRKFKGVFIQDTAGSQVGAGFFLGTDAAGSVLIDP
jgi:hypothetical protein